MERNKLRRHRDTRSFRASSSCFVRSFHLSRSSMRSKVSTSQSDLTFGYRALLGNHSRHEIWSSVESRFFARLTAHLRFNSWSIDRSSYEKSPICVCRGSLICLTKLTWLLDVTINHQTAPFTATKRLSKEITRCFNCGYKFSAKLSSLVWLFQIGYFSVDWSSIGLLVECSKTKTAFRVRNNLHTSRRMLKEFQKLIVRCTSGDDSALSLMADDPSST